MRLALPLVLLAGCSAGEAVPESPSSRTHTFPAVELDPGEERTSDCQSWTLDNDEDLLVTSVTMSAGPGWHHSNWIFVPDDMFDGPDGTWSCASRDYDETQGGLAGGVLFAQSTQSTGETQAFPPGSALVVRERSRIVARIHVLNASTEPLTTDLTLTLQLASEDQVTTRLRPFVMSYFPLDIPPQERSRFTTHCDPTDANDGPLDFSIHYVLPHYHAWGTGLFFRATGAPGGDIVVFDQDATIGEPLGMTLDPPVSFGGATGIDFGCRYHNTTDQPLVFENDDGGEMCMMLAYGDDTRKWIGGALDGPNVVVGTDGEGVILNEAPCGMLRL